jgi:hypothetical protein
LFRAGLWAIKNEAILVDVNLVVIETFFNCHKTLVTKQLAIETLFWSPTTTFFTND